MTRCKKTCKILKEIRQQIAEKNDIEYITSECHFQGECQGTCPKCEAELKYLENELQKRRQLGKTAAIAGISLGIAGSFSACNTPQKQMDTAVAEQEITTDSVRLDTIPNNSKMKPYDLTVLEGDIISIDAFDTIVPTKDFFEDDDVPMGMVDISPEYPGGDEARIKFFAENLKYPDSVKNLPSGKVWIGFVVEADGSLTNFEVVKSLHPLLDAEALRVAKLMPKWIPGTHRKKASNIGYNLPVIFKFEK